MRRYLAQRAELLGAIRLPNNAFKANAGTEVVSDIIFLQKRDRPLDIVPEWTQTGQTEDGFAINQYFIDHPEMVLGRQEPVSTAHGMDYTVNPIEGLELSDQLHDAVKYIHGTYQEAELPELGEGEAIDTSITADPNVKNYSYAIVDGQVYYRENSRMVRPDLNATAEARVKGLVGLRDCVQELIDLQMDAAVPDSTIREKQAELNRLYDSFSAKYGLINDRANRLAYADDSSYYLLCALEVIDEDGKLERKADMFTKRTIKPHQAVAVVDTASEALAVSISEKACVDMDYMSQLTGKTKEALAGELQGVIFRVPGQLEKDGTPHYVTADEYLSGNVRRKLRQAQRAAQQDPVYAVNVEALTAAQPKDLDASEIEVRLGATWIDKEYIQQFMYETFNTPFYLQRSIEVNYSSFTAEWQIKGKSSVSYNDVAAYTTYGTSRANAYKILEDSLNLRDVRIYDTIEDADGKERRVLNAKETTLAAQKQQAIREASVSYTHLGVTVRNAEREANQERSKQDEQSHDLYPERRLFDSRPEAEPAAGENPGQVRQDEEKLPEGTSSHPLQPDAAEREAVPAPSGDRRDRPEQTGADDAPAGEGSGSHRGTESQRSHEVGGADEHLQSPGGGDPDGGAYQQLTLNLFLSEAEQIQSIDDTENVAHTSSAFSFAQNDIDHVLRLGGNTDRQRERVVAAFEKQKTTAEIAEILKTLYHGGNGLGSVSAWYAEDGIHLSHGKSVRYDRSAQVISWESAAERIGELLESGQFASNVELAEAAGYERFLLSEKLWYLYHDFSEEAREAGYLSCLSEIKGNGFPEETRRLTEQLSDPAFRQTLKEEYAAFWTAYHGRQHIPVHADELH